MDDGVDAGAPPATYVPPDDRPGASVEAGGAPATGFPVSGSGSRSSRIGGATSASAQTASKAAGRNRSKVRPVFVVTMARSGSTLLRYLLDSHPEVTSPPELNLSALLSHAAGTWQRVDEALGEGKVPFDAGSGPSEDACRQARKVVDAIMRKCADAAGASVFCDKSLTTVDHLQTVSRCYPKASYIFLYRHPLDLIASGIEASRWGFNAFGFAPFLGSAPGNFVAGLANYWIDRASKMLAFERTCSVAHARIYYELLCDEPKGTLSDLLRFLGLEEDDSMIDAAFERDHGAGPGDYKIDFTRQVSGDSIGRGSTLPHLLAPQQVEQMDKLLAELDYPSLDSVRRGSLRALLGLTATPVSSDGRRIAEELAAVLREGLEVARSHGRRPSLELVLVGDDGRVTAISVDSDRGVSILGEPGPPTDALPRVRCVGDVLLQVASGELNLAQATQDGRVRVETDKATSDRVLTRETLVVLSGLLVPRP